MKKIISLTQGFLAIAAMLIGASLAHAVWTPPTAAPTAGNVDAPVNTGTTSQIKYSTLTLNGNGNGDNGNLMAQGDIFSLMNIVGERGIFGCPNAACFINLFSAPPKAGYPVLAAGAYDANSNLSQGIAVYSDGTTEIGHPDGQGDVNSGLEIIPPDPVQFDDPGEGGHFLGEVSIYPSTSIDGTPATGSAGRNLLSLYSSSDNTESDIGTSTAAITLWSFNANNGAGQRANLNVGGINANQDIDTTGNANVHANSLYARSGLQVLSPNGTTSQAGDVLTAVDTTGDTDWETIPSPQNPPLQNVPIPLILYIVQKPQMGMIGNSLWSATCPTGYPILISSGVNCGDDKTSPERVNEDYVNYLGDAGSPGNATGSCMDSTSSSEQPNDIRLVCSKEVYSNNNGDQNYWDIDNGGLAVQTPEWHSVSLPDGSQGQSCADWLSTYMQGITTPNANASVHAQTINGVQVANLITDGNGSPTAVDIGANAQANDYNDAGKYWRDPSVGGEYSRVFHSWQSACAYKYVGDPSNPNLPVLSDKTDMMGGSSDANHDSSQTNPYFNALASDPAHNIVMLDNDGDAIMSGDPTIGIDGWAPTAGVSYGTNGLFGWWNPNVMDVNGTVYPPIGLSGRNLIIGSLTKANTTIAASGTVNTTRKSSTVGQEMQVITTPLSGIDNDRGIWQMNTILYY